MGKCHMVKGSHWPDDDDEQVEGQNVTVHTIVGIISEMSENEVRKTSVKHRNVGLTSRILRV